MRLDIFPSSTGVVDVNGAPLDAEYLREFPLIMGIIKGPEEDVYFT